MDAIFICSVFCSVCIYFEWDFERDCGLRVEEITKTKTNKNKVQEERRAGLLLKKT